MIGVALIEQCIKRGISVLAIVRKNAARIDRLPKSDLVELYECELHELNELNSQGKQYDVFYHLAWAFTAKAQRDDPVMQEKNIQYTLEAVEAAKRLGCKKFVGAGSQAEYGPTDGIIGPQTRVAPQVSYGAAKFAAGELSRKLCAKYGMFHVWARIFSVYGKHDNEGTMLNYAIDQFIKGERAQFSAATQMWDYLHSSDAGEYFYRIGEMVEENRIFCLASGAYRPLREFISELACVYGEDVQLSFASEDLANKPYGIQADTTSLVDVTGYRPQVSFREGIREVIEYRRSR